MSEDTHESLPIKLEVPENFVAKALDWMKGKMEDDGRSLGFGLVKLDR